MQRKLFAGYHCNESLNFYHSRTLCKLSHVWIETHWEKNKWGKISITFLKYTVVLNSKGCLMSSWRYELPASYKAAGVLTIIFLDRVWRSSNWIRHRRRCWKGGLEVLPRKWINALKAALLEKRERQQREKCGHSRESCFPISNLSFNFLILEYSAHYGHNLFLCKTSILIEYQSYSFIKSR